MSSVSEKQLKLYKSLEALNDILVAETKSKKEKRVLFHLKQLSQHVENLFDLDPNSFEVLMLNPDSHGNKSFFFWDPVSYSKTFAFVVNLYINLYQTAMDTNSEKIELESARGLNQILGLICPTTPKDYIAYEAFLDLYFSEYYKLFDYSLQVKNPRSHSLTYHWYTSMVFRTYEKSDLFNPRFFKYFHKKVFEFLLIAIKRTDFEWFKGFVSWMHHGIFLFDEPYSGLYEFVDYGDIQNYTFQELETLEKKFTCIRSQEDLESWLEYFENVKTEVLSKYASYEAAEEIEKKAYNQYLNSVVKRLIHGIASYLLYMDRLPEIKELWQFKQPVGSSASWAGHSIIPESISELITLFNTSHKRDYFCFHDEHVDCKYYMYTYELCRLIYLVSKQGYPQPNSFTSSTDEVYLSNLKYYVEKLEDRVNDVFQNTRLLDELNLNYTNDIKSNVYGALTGIKRECERKLDQKIVSNELIPSRIFEFIKGFIEAYDKSRLIIDLFKYYGAYIENMGQEKEENSFGIKGVAPKSVFNSQLTMGADMLGSNLARSMVQGKQNNILEKIIQESDKKSVNDLDWLFSKIHPNNALLIAFQSRKLIKSNKFTGAWKSERKIDLSCFEGWFNYKNNSVPVFSFFGQASDQVLLLDKVHLPKLLQYNPGEADYNEKNFRITVSDPNAKPELMDRLIRSELSDADREQKRGELLKKVYFEIFESFELVFDDNYTGFLVDGLIE